MGQNLGQGTSTAAFESDNNQGSSICSDAAGNVCITGFFADSTITFGSVTLSNAAGSPGRQVFIVKYDSLGNVLWAGGSTGSTGMDNEGVAVSADSAGNIYMTGYFNSASITFGGITLNNALTAYNIFIVKYDPSGNVVWARSGNGTQVNEPTGITAAARGYVYVTGFFNSPSITFGSVTLDNHTVTSSNNMFIAKYDTAGNVVWVQGANAGPNAVQANAISADTAGKIYVTGWFNGTTAGFGSITLTNDSTGSAVLFTAKYDSSGNALWVNAVAGSGENFPSSISFDGGGHVYETGTFSSAAITFGSISLIHNPGINPINYYIVKYDTAGNTVWAQGAVGDNKIGGTSINTGTDGSVYTAGYFAPSSAVFGNDTIYNDGLSSIFVVKYDPSGNVVWAKSVADVGGLDEALGITTDAGGDVYTTGYFGNDSITFGPDKLYDPNSGNGYDFFVAKLDNSFSGISKSVIADNVITVYPNPTTGIINFKGIESGDRIEVYNVLGQIVNSGTAGKSPSGDLGVGDNYSLNLSGNAKGVYFYRVTNNTTRILQGKIVLE